MAITAYTDGSVEVWQQEKRMTREYANIIKRLRSQGNTYVASNVVADEMEALICERDEARRAFDIESLLREEAAKARAKALDEAADAVDHCKHPSKHIFQTMQDVKKRHIHAILTLKENYE